MPTAVFDNARNRIQILTNLVFLLSSSEGIPDDARDYITQIQSELMLLSRLVSGGKLRIPEPSLAAGA